MPVAVLQKCLQILSIILEECSQGEKVVSDSDGGLPEAQVTEERSSLLSGHPPMRRTTQLRSDP